MSPDRIEGRFVRVPHQVITEATSLAAIGLAAYLEHLPPTGTFSARGLERRFREGRTVIQAALGELEAQGLIRWTTQQDDTGKHTTLVEHSVTPLVRHLPAAGKQHTPPQNCVDNRQPVIRLLIDVEEQIQEVVEGRPALPARNRTGCPTCQGRNLPACRTCHGKATG